MNAWQGENRRKSPRVHYSCLIVLKNKDSQEQPIMVETENISAGGIAVTSKKAIPQESLLDVTLDVGIKGQIKFVGKVIWSIQRKEDAEHKPSFYDIGVSFAEMRNEDKQCLEKIVGDLKQKKDKDGFYVTRRSLG
jgi:c-di-GMP-binding flagellar brake protein YcgR